MKRVTCDILIGDFKYTGVVNVQIQHGIETLTDTCVLTFPRKVAWKDKKITDLIKRGNDLIVKLGYDDNNDKVFTGIIRDINADIPVTVNTDDLMFKLKKNSIKTSFQKVSLKEILTQIIPEGITWKAADINLGKFRINNATPAKVLAYLKSKYGIYSFFRNGILYSGLKYWGEYQKSHELSFTKDIVSDNLTYKKAEDIKYKVVAISIADDNGKTEITKGDDDGEQRTFHYYNVDKKELERRAEQELEKLKYDGYRGTFITFCQSAIFHGDTVKLIDKRYPEREGTYIVKSVVRNFGTRGNRQTIELDRLWK
ncbi:MAG: hypothetical protein L3J56_06975 [Bacteroidales bacterium]|nr:hypothetical protein [Bacteroidales bacterium]